MKRLAVLLAIALLASAQTRDARGRIRRNPAVRAAFMRTHPCPATGKKAGACRGWIVEHVVRLACGGADDPSNLQWQTTEEAKRKDAEERAAAAKVVSKKRPPKRASCSELEMIRFA